MVELLEFLETLKCEFENKGMIKSWCFDELVVEGTCYLGKHNNVSTRIFQTICNKKSYSHHMWTWTHWMFLSVSLGGIEAHSWIRGQFLSFAIPTRLIELYGWIEGEQCVF